MKTHFFVFQIDIIYYMNLVEVEVLASKYISKTVCATIKMPFRTTKESHWWTAESFLFLNHWLESISYKALGSFSVCKLNMCQAGISIERRFTPASRSQGFPQYSFPSYIFIFLDLLIENGEWNCPIQEKAVTDTLLLHWHTPALDESHTSSLCLVLCIKLIKAISAPTFEFVSLKNQVITFMSFLIFFFF